MKLNLLAKLLVPLALILLVSGCGIKQGAGKGSGSGDHAWNLYAARATAAEVNTGPFRISGTIRYTGQDGKTTRASSLLWGNGSLESPHPLRLDLLAGVGNVVAKIREDSNSFIAYVPDEDLAYTHASGDDTLLSFGVPVPMSLSDLTLLLTGRNGAIFMPSKYSGGLSEPENLGPTQNGQEYRIAWGDLPGILEISNTGVPLSWKETGRDGWEMTFETRVENPMEIRRLRITHPKGYGALVVVQEFERLKTPFAENQLNFTLPGNVAIKSLD